MSGGTSSYHHGDLPATLVHTAVEMLDADGGADLSIRAVARQAGVSSAAPYRHFPDRPALLSAVAAVGFRDLLDTLVAACPTPASAEELAELGVAYVRFALERPGLFRVMFGERGQRGDPGRRDATRSIHAYLDAGVHRAFGIDEPAATTTGLWALVHGLACLYLAHDGRDRGRPPRAVPHAPGRRCDPPGRAASSEGCRIARVMVSASHVR